jgi:pyrroloquinoline quinone biosynthesis protein D
VIQDTAVLSLAEGISFRPLGVGQGGVLLMVGSGQLFTCNDTTSVFLAALDGRRTFADLVRTVLDEFEVSEDELRSDLRTLADDLQQRGIVRVQ